MALTKIVTIENKFLNVDDYTNELTQTETIENAYIVISDIRGNKENLTIAINIYTEDKTKIKQIKRYCFTPSVGDGAVNFIAQGYEYLKTLDEFKDATDC